MKPKLLSYLQLFRLPNVFTAVADILMGFFVTVQMVKPQLFFLVAASTCLYCAGMVLNDVMDFDIDKEERPDRPLPSGRIDREWAKRLGFGLLGLGVAIATTVSPISGCVALALAVAIYLYDGPLKSTAMGPWVMGSCRTLNVLLGMSMAVSLLQPDHLLIAGGLGIYVAGITWFARSEAKTSERRLLVFGFAVMTAGIVLLGMFPYFSAMPLRFRAPIFWPTLLIVLMSSIVRLCVFAITKPEPTRVQRAVKQSLFTLIVLDAAVVLALCQPPYAIAVIVLLLPTVLLGKWVYST